MLLLVLLLLQGGLWKVEALDNGVALVPPMGYTTWNDLGTHINETIVMKRCSALVSTGLAALGFQYCNLDDGWPASARDPASQRIVASPSKFPSGMASLAARLHALGLKAGLYTDRGSRTCGGLPGSLGFEALDAQTYAEWAFDFVKEDNCHAPGGPHDKVAQLRDFGAMRDGLNATGRRIAFAVCGGGGEAPWANLSYFAEDPFGARLANLWRVGPDTVEWLSMRHNLALDSTLARFAGPGGWNDPDLLLTSSRAAKYHLSPLQSRAQFAMWAVLAAPLLISGPVGELSAWDMETYSNAEVVAVNQDASSSQGIPLYYEQPLGERVILGRRLASGALAAVFVNAGVLGARNVTCADACWEATRLPAGTGLHVRDLWARAPARAAVVGEPYSVHLPADGGSAMFVFTVA